MSLIGGAEAQRFYENHCKEFLYAPSVARSPLSDGVLRKTRLVRENKLILKTGVIRFASKMLWNPADQDYQFIIRYAEQHSIDVIWFGYGNTSFDLVSRVKKAKPGVKIVCDTDSVWSRFLLRELPYEKNPVAKLRIYRAGKKKEKEERAWVNLADITTAVSEVDAEYYRSIAKFPERVRLFSNVIDVDQYRFKQDPPADLRHPAIYLAGTFWERSPMDKAARWFIQDMLPKIKQAIPDVQLYIIGKGSIETLSDINDPNITITGKLPSVLPYLQNVDVAIVPLQFESGTRFKILEAGACDIPVVSTTLGAEGLPAVHGKDILIADTPEEFARAIIKLLKDRDTAKQLGQNLYRLVSLGFSIGALEVQAREILERLS